MLEHVRDAEPPEKEVLLQDGHGCHLGEAEEIRSTKKYAQKSRFLIIFFNFFKKNLKKFQFFSFSFRER